MKKLYRKIATITVCFVLIFSPEFNLLFAEKKVSKEVTEEAKKKTNHKIDKKTAAKKDIKKDTKENSKKAAGESSKKTVKKDTKEKSAGKKRKGKKRKTSRTQIVKGTSLQKLNRDLKFITKNATPCVVHISGIKAASRIYHRGRKHQKKYKPRQQNRSRSLGSGVIINKKGFIVTNNHVVRNSRDLRITLYDKREYRCTIVGTDSATDLAVIKISGKAPKNLPAIIFGDSDRLEVGEIVVAIGNPFGFSHTVTMGIVSAKGRQNIGLVDYEDYIQTDAAINPGNSGGALIDVNGKLVGVNTAMYTRSGGYMGIGFAIPSIMAKKIIDSLIKNGKVVRGWLGVYIQEVTSDIAESLKLSKSQGVLITDIIKETPAYGSGMQVGDIIVSIDKKEITDMYSLRKIIAAKKPGTKIKVRVFRKGKYLNYTITIGTLPDKKRLASRDTQKPGDEIGIEVKDIDEKLAYKHKIKDTRGVIITTVKRNSFGSIAGLMKGDLIKEIDQKPIDNRATYNRIFKNLKGRKKIIFLIKRGAMNRFFVVQMEK